MTNRIAIGQLNNQRAALAFCDYLKTKNIKAWAESEESSFLVLINDPAAVGFASAELRDFLNNPSDSKYLDASWSEGSIDLNYSTQIAEKISA
ncbi:MAG: hypothetical protein GY829_02960, partial [Gammaproteobacteria bacterium]|nr:hypothetical protein [Gammaproteobacteria bacterium]